jgi:3-deoxy-D-manno-octulosonic-acid transferase
MSLLRSSYYGLSWLGAPLISGYLRWRSFKKHEDKNRIRERVGFSSLPRPEKSLLWVHAVSGKSVAVLPLSSYFKKIS